MNWQLLCDSRACYCTTSARPVKQRTSAISSSSITTADGFFRDLRDGLRHRRGPVGRLGKRTLKGAELRFFVKVSVWAAPKRAAAAALRVQSRVQFCSVQANH